VVAVAGNGPGEELAGIAVATVSGARAWVMRISLAAAWRHRGIGSAMLGELERRLVAAGVHRIQCLLAGESEIGALALEHAGYTARPGVVFYERLEPVRPGSAGVLGQLGGRMVRAGAWEQLGGMVKEKELIERRVILPLAQPQLAGRLGLVPPRAIVLFGPPGTGKTTFAKGAASRLGWPFVELFPSRLAGESPAGLAAALREAFALVGELDKVVVFIDEVEEIAGARQPRTASAALGVTNEMLKRVRRAPDRAVGVRARPVRARERRGDHGRRAAGHRRDQTHPDLGGGGRVRAGHPGLRPRLSRSAGRVEQVVDQQELGDGQRFGAQALPGPAQAGGRPGVGAEPGPDGLLDHLAILAGRIPVDV